MKKVLWYIAFAICIVAVIFSSVEIYITLSERKESNDFYEETASNFFNTKEPDTVSEPPAESNAQQPKQSGGAVKKSVPKEPVSFSTLLEQNPTAKAWIFSPNTKINYPIAQYTDNSYYLNHLINGKKNSAGALFIDYNNKSDFTDLNTVIYGHSMRNHSMFGEITYYKNQSYYDKHPIMYLFTPDASYILNIFCGFTTDGTSDLYLVPANASLCKEQIAYGMANSTFKSNVKVESGDKIVTLSTCSYEKKSKRYVIMAKLEKQ